MRAGIRLAGYGAGLAVLFGSAFVIANAVVPDRTVQSWKQAADRKEMNHGGSEGAHVRGIALEQDGYRLSPVTAPDRVGVAGPLSFRIMNAHGPLTEFETSHEKQLHLIVVRSDGTQFRHVHPAMRADGTWSIPWTWPTGGSYRVFADFVPPHGDNVTLTRSVDVAGPPFTPPVAARPSTRASVDGFDVKLTGDLHVESESPLTVEITRDGRPVTDVQPYLGAFGHLVALREGDLAYLHVHPDGAEPAPGDRSGPRIRFTTEAPTPGRYLLYLDFRVDGAVHTAPFVIDTADETSGA